MIWLGLEYLPVESFRLRQAAGLMEGKGLLQDTVSGKTTRRAGSVFFL